MIADECCTGHCLQGRECPLRTETSVKASVATYLIASAIACLFVAFIGAAQIMDEHDEQTAARQVMACSEFPVECLAFEKSRASTAKNRRQ